MTEILMWGIVVTLILIVILTVWCACIVASRSDRENTKLNSEIYRKGNRHDKE